MKKLFIVIIGFFCLSISEAQILNPPPRRDFNIGLYLGVGGVNFVPIPCLDIHYKANTLRLAPSYRVNGFGYIREIRQISPVFYNWYWIGSVYAAKGFTYGRHALTLASLIYDSGEGLRTDVYSGSLLTGLRVFYGKKYRWYSQFQGGAIYYKYQTIGYADEEEVTPHFEFGVGFNFLKPYGKRTFSDEQ